MDGGGGVLGGDMEEQVGADGGGPVACVEFVLKGDQRGGAVQVEDLHAVGCR